METYRLDSLNEWKPQLRADAHKLLGQTKDIMGRIVLGTTLIRLGDTSVASIWPADLDQVEEQRFRFYIANISSLFPHWIRRMFLHSPICIYQFYSPAYNDALLLEYLVLSNPSPSERRS
jgi:hypothetical protein